MRSIAFKITFCIGFIISLPTNAELFTSENDAKRNIDLLERQRLREQVEEEKKQEREYLENKTIGKNTFNKNIGGNNYKFKVKKIELLNDNVYNLSSQRSKIIEKYINTEMGNAEIFNLIAELTNFYIKKGFVTTQVTVVPSTLKDGELTLRVLWGTLLNFQHNGKNPGVREKIRLFSAMPFTEGKPLNISDIDQALDNIMRVSPSDRLQIAATDKTGKSIINHISERNIPLSLHMGMNNSGYKDSGWNQYYASSTLKNIVGINDLLNYYYSYNDLNNKNDKQNSKSISYSFPFGYWVADFSYYQSNYIKTIGGMYNGGYKSDGSSRRYTLKISNTLFRNDKGKVTGYLKTESRKNSNNIMNVPISVSSKNYSSVSSGLTWVGPFSNGWGYTDLSMTMGRPWFNSAWKNDPDLKGFDINYKKINGIFNWNKNLFELIPGKASIDYEFNGAFQYTTDQLVSDARYTIGDEYTIRGYKENSISAERVAWISNTFKIPVNVNYATIYKISPFVGIDLGMARKNCLSDSSCDKDYLSGAAAGIKFNSKYFNSSVSSGWPMKKPKSLQTTKLDNYNLYFNFDIGF